MTKISVKKPFTVLVAVVLVLVLGIVSFMNLTTDLLPKMDLPYVIVLTTAPGASPERVETTVTQPLESALATTSGLENMKSISMENASLIIMEFSQNVNMDSAMIEMSSNIDMVEGYFEDTVSSPMLMKMNPDMLPVQVLSVDMDGMDIKQLSEYIENDFKPYLERIDGVATVDVSGLVQDHVSIRLNQEKIDEINDSILKAVSDELYSAKKDLDKAKQELADGKQELADGKKELEDGKQEAFDKLAEGAAKLDAGQAQLLDITSQKISLEAKIALLEGARPAIEALEKLKLASVTIDAMQQQYGKEMLQKIKGIEDIDSYDKEEIEQLFNELTIGEIKEFLIDKKDNSFPPVTSMEKRIIEAYLEALNALTTDTEESNALFSDDDTIGFVKSSLQESIDTLSKTLSDMGVSQSIIATGSTAALDNEISDAQAEIKRLDFMLSQAQTSVEQLQKAYEELEMAKMQAVSGMAVGEAQLNAVEAQLKQAEEQLKSGTEEFEKAQKEALRKANIDSLVTQSMISTILSAQNFSMPAGYMDFNGERVTVKVGEKFSDLESLENLLLVDMGLKGVEPIYLKDVADISIEDNSADSFVKVNGNDGIVLSISKSSVASTSEVSKNVTKAIKQLEKKTEGLHITTLMDQGDYIGMIVKSVLSNLVYGGLIALVVLAIFLKSARPTAIIAMSIPLSVLVAIVAMYFTGVTLNIISLSGLSLAIGMLVDNSIVVIENIFRLRAMGYGKIKAAVIGTKQVSGAIAASTLTTVCVFLPIVFTQGLTRQIFTDMGLTIAYVLVASLAVALTFVPCLASRVLGEKHNTTPEFMQKLTEFYRKALRLNLKHRWVVIVLAVALLAVSVINALTMPMTFIPAMDGPQMTMTLSLPGDVSDEELYRQGWDIAQRAQQVQEVETVAVMTGGSSISALTSSAGNNKTLSFYVVMQEDRKLSNVEIASLINDALPEYKETLSITTESIDMSALGGSGLSIDIKGNDLDTLAAISADLADIIRDIDGIDTVDDGKGERSGEMRIEIDKTAAMKAGLTTAQIYQKVAEALTEETTTTTFTFDNKDLKGYITSDAKYDRDTIENLKIASKINDDGDEEVTTLGMVATVTQAESPNSITRYNQSRMYTVSATFEEGANSTVASRKAQAAAEAYELPDGYQISMGGENKMVMEMLSDMALMILLAVIFIYLIMVAQFQSLLSPFIVMFTIPLAFTGGLLALQLTGTVLSIVSMIGFLVLTGVVVNNGIVFIDCVNQLRDDGMELYEALEKAGTDRIRPILMTALTTILAMSTMAFGVGMGAEMCQGMAIVSIGGLTYATLLTLFLVPSLYSIMHKRPHKVIEVDFEED